MDLGHNIRRRAALQLATQLPWCGPLTTPARLEDAAVKHESIRVWWRADAARTICASGEVAKPKEPTTEY